MNTLNAYLLDLGERAVKSAAQAAILALGGNEAATALNLNATGVHWSVVGGFAAGGAILSILTSLASAPVNGNGTASLVKAIVSAPTITTKGNTTMAPIAADGVTEYTTYPGIPDQTETPAPVNDPSAARPAEQAPTTPVESTPIVSASEVAAAPAPAEVVTTPAAEATPAPVEATPTAEPASTEVTVDEPVQENGDGTITVNGVVYHP